MKRANRKTNKPSKKVYSHVIGSRSVANVKSQITSKRKSDYSVGSDAQNTTKTSKYVTEEGSRGQRPGSTKKKEDKALGIRPPMQRPGQS